MNNSNNKHIIVIGAGAAGMMAAGRAAESGAAVIILEKKDQPGRKLLIAGNGRCNLTNARTLIEFLPMYGQGSTFIRNVFSRFFREELLDLLEQYNLKTMTESDGRIFPQSGTSRSVVESLNNYLTANNVVIHLNTRVNDIRVVEGQVYGVNTERGYYPATAVILAAGGASYSKTGSNGDGFTIAQKLSHSITKIRPALVPLQLREKTLISRMQGVSLQNIRLSAFKCPLHEITHSKITKQFGRGLSNEKPPHKLIESRIGDIVFTHYGISGPAALQMSLAINDALERNPVSISIDLFPDLTEEQLHQKLQALFKLHGRRSFQRILDDLLPNKMVKPFSELIQVPPERQISYITGEQRKTMVTYLKSLRFSVAGSLPLDNALVTAGGISLKEIDPRTMMSKLIKGLFFCGEVMDIDADTGGYNLQAAFSTGYIAGESAAKYVSMNRNSQISSDNSDIEFLEKRSKT